ncbi:MAG: DUF429 domain-containing protein [Roseibium sp.]|uniref:hypothetical protein n=1 Tax=Roseibium sp. TaxID=1936156 RepID=UPI003D9C4AD7
MFFEGAGRLLDAGVTIPHLHKGDPNRIVVEAYPGIIARTLIGCRSYKNDTKKKQTSDHFEARLAILETLQMQSPHCYGFAIEASKDLCDDPGADHLDALLCAVQAAWAWQRRDKGFGVPLTVDAAEGWIADPSVVEALERRCQSEKK